ncbi:endonuclease domain-containing protein [Streptomyces platensis]|uniref:endonuclease domain-containing protein n=1 Tax=Streptomyces platensis TaxID=58346 RepID=UPI00386A16FD|nr:endonuclease VII domain-containing protein [Streptomyces platensis]
MPACLRHLEPEELGAVQQMLEGAQRLVDRWLPHLAPACWFWPLPAAVLDSASFSMEASLFTWQQDRCAICGRHGRRGGTSSDSLVLDHDHQTDQTRGFLCHPCNKRESQRDPGDGRFANYRRRPPAVMLGYAARYSHVVRRRLPLPRHEPTAPSPADLSRSLAKIRKMAPQIEEQLRTAAETPKSHKYVGEDVWLALQALVPVLRVAVERADHELPQVDLGALVDWLQQFPPSPAQQ